MTKSTVVDNDTGKSVDSTVRTSTGTFFARGQDPIIAAVEKKVSLVSLGDICPARSVYLETRDFRGERPKSLAHPVSLSFQLQDTVRQSTNSSLS